ncbi:MAG: HAD family phosphatase [Erysipelotrichaceae bacterium]|nr:HAD family phosphatase [Erysipelotrichaceae bacterium]
MQGVIFDFNGTLFLDNDKHILAWNKISRLLRNCDISDKELHDHFNGVPNQLIIPYLMGKECSADEIQYYSMLKEQYYREYCLEDITNFHLTNGAISYFELLIEQHIPMTIASASIKENMDFFICHFHLDQWFNISKIVYDDGSYENKVSMYLQAAQNINISITDCMIYEDALSGITSAYQAGCSHIIVLNSANKRQEYQQLPGVVQVIDDFKEVL